jgi:hypothetical protein
MITRIPYARSPAIALPAPVDLSGEHHHGLLEFANRGTQVHEVGLYALLALFAGMLRQPAAPTEDPGDPFADALFLVHAANVPGAGGVIPSSLR